MTPQSTPSRWRFQDGWVRFPLLEKKFDIFLGSTLRAAGDMKDRALFSRALRRAGLPIARAAGGRQVHGVRVLWAKNPSKSHEGSSGVDGVATEKQGLALRVHAADCAPVFLVDGKSRAVALIHAGRRGTARGILSRAVDLLTRKKNTHPSDLWMVVGPCIRSCCYEVGQEVAREFPGAIQPRPKTPSKFFLDLPAALNAQARRVGIRRNRIFAAPFCTACARGAGGRNGFSFFSFRRDATAERAAALIVRRK